jgi:hypothetical protein
MKPLSRAATRRSKGASNQSNAALAGVEDSSGIRPSSSPESYVQANPGQNGSQADAAAGVRDINVKSTGAFSARFQHSLARERLRERRGSVSFQTLAQVELRLRRLLGL